MYTYLLNNSQLLMNTKELASNERKITAKILEHLEEIERRKLYSKLKYGSLFEYCLNELKYSPAQTYRRLDAMKLAKGNKQIKSEIGEGNLSLTNANQISDLFKNVPLDSKEKKQVIQQASGATKRECESIIDQIKIDKGIQEEPKRETKRKDGNRIRLHISLDEKTVEKIKHLKGLLAHKKNYKTDELIDIMLDNMIETVESKKYKSVRKSNVPVSKTRYIKREIRTEVYKRANGKCQNCNSTYALEIDHINHFAGGGSNEPSNLQLLCRNCNARKAIDDFGQAKMDVFFKKTG